MVAGLSGESIDEIATLEEVREESRFFADILGYMYHVPRCDIFHTTEDQLCRKFDT